MEEVFISVGLWFLHLDASIKIALIIFMVVFIGLMILVRTRKISVRTIHIAERAGGQVSDDILALYKRLRPWLQNNIWGVRDAANINHTLFLDNLYGFSLTCAQAEALCRYTNSRLAGAQVYHQAGVFYFLPDPLN
jgi:hypothetical protein